MKFMKGRRERESERERRRRCVGKHFTLQPANKERVTKLSTTQMNFTLEITHTHNKSFGFF